MGLDENDPFSPFGTASPQVEKRQVAAVGTCRFPTCGEAVPKGLKGSFSSRPILVETLFHQNGSSSMAATSGSSSVRFLRKRIASRRSKAAHLTTQMSQEQFRLRFGGPEGSPKRV